MNWWPWKKRGEPEESAPDTLREGHVPAEVRLQSIDARLNYLELVVGDIAKAVCGQDYTIKGHLSSHARDARREHLRSVPTLSEDA